MLRGLQKTGQIALLLLPLCVPAAATASVAPGAITGLKPAITDSPVRAGRSIQLGAWRSEAEARTAWMNIKRRAGSLLMGLAPDIVPVDLAGKGRYYRLRVGLSDSGSAVELCAALKAKHLECVMVPD